VQDWIKHGRVLVNGRTERAAYTVRPADTIDVEPAEEEEEADAEDAPVGALEDIDLEIEE